MAGPPVGMHRFPFMPPRAKNTLLGSAYVLEYDDDAALAWRWENGLDFVPEGCSEVFCYEDCPVDAEGNPVDKEGKPVAICYGSCVCHAKTLGAPFKCSTSQGLSVAEMNAHACRNLDIGLTKGVECMLHDMTCAALSDPGCVLYGGEPVNLTTAIAGLDQYLANCGAGLPGAIHVPAGLATRLCQCRLAKNSWGHPLYDELGMPRTFHNEDLLPPGCEEYFEAGREDDLELMLATLPSIQNRFAGRSVLETCGRGNIVIAGAGYSGLGPVDPEAEPEEPADPSLPTSKVWIYATGIPTVFLGPVQTPASTMAEAMTRSVNMVEVVAERSALVLNPGCCHAAVCVDLCLPTGCC